MNDDRQAVFEKVRAAIVKQSDSLTEESVTLDSPFEDLGLDSLDATEILFELEEELDVDIPNEEARQMQNVRQVVEGLEALIAKKAASAGTGEA